MKELLDYSQVAPEGIRAWRELETYVRGCGLERSLLELVKTRASQLNGWNRLSVAFHTVPGSYQPTEHAPAASGPREAASR